MRLSVVIPTLDEAGAVRTAVLSAPPGAEVVVADGGSADATQKVAERAGARVIAAPRGRALQMNAGARASAGDVLLFLHADSVLPDGADRSIADALNERAVVGGSFRLRIVPGSPALGLIAFGSNLRSRYLGFPYGDQGLFMRRSTFEWAGGFPEIPFLEDVAMVRTLRRLGRLVQVPLPIVTGPRHWSRLGPVRTTLLNWRMVGLYLTGAAPERLARAYARHRHAAAKPPGAPKPRLAQPD